MYTTFYHNKRGKSIDRHRLAKEAYRRGGNAGGAREDFNLGVGMSGAIKDALMGCPPGVDVYNGTFEIDEAVCFELSWVDEDVAS